VCTSHCHRQRAGLVGSQSVALRCKVMKHHLERNSWSVRGAWHVATDENDGCNHVPYTMIPQSSGHPENPEPY
jgi:hypothetical protein